MQSLKPYLFEMIKRVVFGDDQGYIILWNIYTDKYYPFKAHSDCITDIVQHEQNYIISCFFESTIKLWFIKERQYISKGIYDWYYKLVGTFDKHSYSLINVILTEPKTFASIDITGVLYLWKVVDRTYCICDDSLKKKDINGFWLFYCRKQKVLLKCNNGTIYFVYVNPFKIEQRTINGILIASNSSICQSREGELYIGGYKENNMIPSLFIINVDSKAIETIVDYDFFYKEYNPMHNIFHLFELNKDIVIFTQEGYMILLNKTTLRSKRFIRKKDCLSLFSINPLNATSFLGVARRNHIIYYSFSYDHI